MTPSRFVALAGLVTLMACGGGPAVPPAPSPEEIPALESSVSDRPDDYDLALLLASAYREADRSADAADLIRGLRADAPEHLGLLVFDAVLTEEEGRLEEAGGLYREALALGPDGDLASELERRLQALRDLELRQEVRDALAREQSLDASPDPSTVGVLPFVYRGDDPEWEPLRLALAEMLVTDLAVSGRITLVERVKVQALLDEVELGESGRVDEATAARGGRLLGSGRIVQGVLALDQADRVSVEAAVVDVGTEAGLGDPLREEDAVSRLFDMEKRLALDIYSALGVTLTQAERARVNERQTESVQALLAFGRGLAATDRGDFEQAEAHFAEAASIDPGFAAAQARRQRAFDRSVSAVRQLQGRTTLNARKRQAVAALRNASGSARARMLARMNQRQRAVLAEVLGQDRLGTSVLLELVFHRPGGEP